MSGSACSPLKMLASLGAALVFACTPQAATLTYRFFAGKDTVVSTCVVSKDGAGTKISSEWRSDTMNFHNELQIDKSSLDRAWTAIEQTKGTNLRLVRAGDSLVLSGTFRGKPVAKTYDLKGTAWKQMMPHDLGDFALSSSQSLTFTGVGLMGPYALKPYSLQAERIGDETITVQGGSVSAVHVRIAPTGLFSALWHGDYWFRKSDGVFVRSVSLGMMGGPSATMVLTAEQ
jgi:hypothetical protein